ncbi:hypothetical protein HGB07_01795 [Candidatus Roizmanbacteria bacterium]|nr:hypothetical protein [Candidatus Roizmanbacteria bacterium]
MHKVIFTANTFSEKQIEVLRQKGINIVKQPSNLSEGNLIEALQDAEGYILGGDEIATKHVIEMAKHLKIISFLGVGYERYIDVRVAKEHGIVVTNTPGANSQAVAEFTVSLILDVVKKITYLNELSKNGIWEKPHVWNLHNRTVGIIGMGNIGSKVAKILHDGFGMRVIYVSRSVKGHVEEAFGAKKVTLDELFAQSDVVSVHVAQADETVNMIKKQQLTLMKPTSILVNTARAEIIDGHALYEALITNQLSAAAFDAYYIEPLPERSQDEYKLMSLPNDKFVLTTHNAYNSIDAIETMNEMIINGLIDMFEGRKPIHQI